MINGKATRQMGQWEIVVKALATLSYQSGDLRSYLNEISCTVSQLIQSDWSIITIQENALSKIVASNLDMGGIEIEFAAHESISEIVVQSQQVLSIENVQHYPDKAQRMQGYASYLGAPLELPQGKVIGTICSFCMKPRCFDPETIEMVKVFAKQAAIAIDNHRLYELQQQLSEHLEAEVAKQTKDLRSAQTKLLESERLAAIDEFATLIVHEIRNPLATVQMGLDYFAKLTLPQPAKTRLSLALDEAERLTKLLREILSYSKPQIFRLSEINIHDLIQELLPLMQAMPEMKDRPIEYFPAQAPVTVLGDAVKLKQVFLNLIRNICEAVRVGETIRWLVTKPQSGYVAISIQSSGSPVSADVLSQLSYPFYPTKSETVGLGLALAKRIIEAHSGELIIEVDQPKGTVFSVKFPVRESTILSNSL